MCYTVTNGKFVLYLNIYFVYIIRRLYLDTKFQTISSYFASVIQIRLGNKKQLSYTCITETIRISLLIKIVLYKTQPINYSICWKNINYYT